MFFLYTAWGECLSYGLVVALLHFELTALHARSHGGIVWPDGEKTSLYVSKWYTYCLCWLSPTFSLCFTPDIHSNTIPSLANVQVDLIVSWWSMYLQAQPHPLTQFHHLISATGSRKHIGWPNRETTTLHLSWQSSYCLCRLSPTLSPSSTLESNSTTLLYASSRKRVGWPDRETTTLHVSWWSIYCLCRLSPTVSLSSTLYSNSTSLLFASSRKRLGWPDCETTTLHVSWWSIHCLYSDPAHLYLHVALPAIWLSKAFEVRSAGEGKLLLLKGYGQYECLDYTQISGITLPNEVQ